jgi:hypothetical protein
MYKTTFVWTALFLSALALASADAPPGIALDPATVNLRPGQSKTFTANLTDPVLSTNLVWQIAPALGTIDSNGKYTAPATPPGVNRTVDSTQKNVSCRPPRP